MKIILGVDLQEAYLPALHLVAKLGFPSPEITLVQAAPTVESTLPPFPVDGAVIDFVQRTFREAAEGALAQAGAESKRLGLATTALFCTGPSGELINEVVDDQGADLVAVRSTHYGAWQSEFMGSVSRVVVLGGKTSVLVAKQEPPSGPTVDAVFGADGSDFNVRCVDRFISLHAGAIGSVHVVSAWGCASQFEHILRHELHHNAELDRALEGAATSAAEAVAARLRAAGFTADAQAVHGTPEHVLGKAMERTGAELMVVGAHGKGWIERLLIGSSSLHQVINEPYNVLLLRP